MIKLIVDECRTSTKSASVAFLFNIWVFLTELPLFESFSPALQNNAFTDSLGVFFALGAFLYKILSPLYSSP